MSSTANSIKFLVLCLVWGLTWIAVKFGVDTVPPMLFAATRFIAAGLLLLLWASRKSDRQKLRTCDYGRLIVVSVLMISLCYGPLFWGMKFVPSGTAAVLEMSLTPLALLAFGLGLGEERWSLIGAVSMVIGVAGLIVLFSPTLTDGETSGFMWAMGIGAVAWAAISSAWGSVLARPLITRYGSVTLSGSTTLIGGAILLVVSVWFEPIDTAGLFAAWTLEAVAGWAFLVVFGSLIGYSIYMQLLRDIGPAKAGSFAFVSPAIAVSVGAIVAGEAITQQGLLGMMLMLVAAAGSLFANRLGEMWRLWPGHRQTRCERR